MSKRMTDSQIVTLLKKAEAGIPVKDICHEYGIEIQPFINGEKNTEEWKRPMSIA